MRYALYRESIAFLMADDKLSGGPARTDLNQHHNKEEDSL